MGRREREARRYSAQMSPTMALRHLATEPAPERYIPAVLPWVIDAGNPYFDWFFGKGQAPRWIERWMRRPSSEVAIGRVVVAELDGEPIGGYITIGGRELSVCRIADGVTTLAEAGGDSSVIRARMEMAKGLFPAVAPDDLYLSKVGLLRPYRRKGFARGLVETFLDDGRIQGFKSFRLDVSADHHRAIELYRRAGFHVVSEARIPGTSLGYLAMRLRR
jgi:ribosomal protein S18 acetylase RimI-like enzyme